MNKGKVALRSERQVCVNLGVVDQSMICLRWNVGDLVRSLLRSFKFSMNLTKCHLGCYWGWPSGVDNLVLSTGLIMWIGHHHWRDSIADVSSVSPSSIRSDEGLTGITPAFDGGQFTISTELMKPHFLFSFASLSRIENISIISNNANTTVSGGSRQQLSSLLQNSE